MPRYQFFFRVGLWILFLVCYTLAIQTPDRGFGPEDIILYTQLLGYLVEDLVKVRIPACGSLQSGRRRADICYPPSRSTRLASTRPSRCGRSSTGSFTHSPLSLSCAFILSAARSRAFASPSLTCFLLPSLGSAALISVPMTKRNRAGTDNSRSVSLSRFHFAAVLTPHHR